MVRDVMATRTERSKALHNFTMPLGLRWGSQRFLRCMKVNSNGQISPLHRFAAADRSGPADQRHHHPIQQRHTNRDRDGERRRDSSSEFLHGSPKVIPTLPPTTNDRQIFGHSDDGIAAMREKVMFDLQTAADKMKDAIFKDGLEEGKVSISPPLPPPLPASGEVEVPRPWNLRSRRAVKISAGGISSGRNDDATAPCHGNGLRVEAPRLDSALPQGRASAVTASPQKSPIHHGGEMPSSGRKRERPKFSVALSKKDIEEDFFQMVGHRPPRRPKKRAKMVQKELDTLFPGLWLTEVTPDMYKVPEGAP